MASFSDLPNELLIDVCSVLAQEDLAHMCLVSHNLRSVVKPFLYRDVLLSTSGKTIPVFESFLHTISSNPALRNYVQSLTLRWNYTPEPAWYHHHELLNPPPFDAWLFGMIMSMVGVKSPPRYQGDHVIPLLRVLPRLEVLHLWPSGDLEMFDRPLGHADLPVFEHLREVKCCWRNSRSAMHHATFMFLLMHPSMRKFEARLANTPSFGTHGQIPESCIGKSMVTDLRLSYGNMVSGTLEKILLVPQALTHFSYTEIPMALCDIPQVGLVLGRTIGRTLQFLALTLGHESNVWNRQWNLNNWANLASWTNVPIGSLLEWPVLWSIRTSLTVLLGRGRAHSTLRLIDVLPLVIREFEIELDPYWTATEVADEVVEMLRLHGAGHFDELAVIMIPGEVFEVARGIGEACDVAGVELVLTRYR